MQNIVRPYFTVGLSEMREISVKPVLLVILLAEIILSVFFVVMGAIDEWMTSEPVTWFVILGLIPLSGIRLVILFSLSFRDHDGFMTDLILVRGISRLEYFVGKIVGIYVYFVAESLILFGAVAYFSKEFSVPEANDIELAGLLSAYITVLIILGLAGSILSCLSASGLATLKIPLVFFLMLCIAFPLMELVRSISVVPEAIFQGYGDIVRGVTDLSRFLALLFLASLVATVGAYRFFLRRDF
ncbi:MAG: hypothetical protein VYD09_00650 [Chloroflexota bacterium]|nr:hypothetical protein [Chloroflexota bacterium]